MLRAEQNNLIRRIRKLNGPLRIIPAAIKPRLKRLPHVRAVLCDVYGTLLASAADQTTQKHVRDPTEFFQAALGALHCKLDKPASVCGVNLFYSILAAERARLQSAGVVYPEIDIRLIWKKVLNALRRRFALKLNLNRKMLCRIAIEYENRINPVWPMPRVEKALSDLALKGMVLGVVSNAQFYTPLTLTALFGRRWMSWFPPQLRFWSYKYGEAKPGLLLYRRAAQRLKNQYGIRPHETVMIGNGVENDILPALDCGMRAVLFAGDRRACCLDDMDQKKNSTRSCPIIINWQQLVEILED